MTRHNDLSRTHALLEGSQGWIIENHQEAIIDHNKKRTRRSKKRCIYYCDRLCNHAHAICMGVSCGSYFETYYK